jgi:hypothetical protein
MYLKENVLNCERAIFQFLVLTWQFNKFVKITEPYWLYLGVKYMGFRIGSLLFLQNYYLQYIVDRQAPFLLNFNPKSFIQYWRSDVQAL